MAKHFTKVIPTIAASIQAGADFANEDILFDWHKVDGFKGSEINGITAIVRGLNGADQTIPDFELLFATSGIKEVSANISVDQAPPSLGTVNSGVSTYQWKNNLTGHLLLDVDGNAVFNDGDLDVLNLVTVSGLNIPVGQDLYMAAITKGALDFRSTVQVSTETATNTTAVVVKTTGALINFAPGDVLHDEDDLVIGTVKSVTDDTNIVLTENCANVSAVNKDLYNIHPVQFILSSEG
jgi:hypothetical protein|tara:strand:- start:51 stop:764 length:714 start_codon:yes stop_codon:yes gene_type:complete